MKADIIPDSLQQPEILRHKAAKRRTKPSAPLMAAFMGGILEPGMTILDYGCGRGFDVRWLKQRGYECCGYDPYYFPEPRPKSADVVMLSYVVSVIEDHGERERVLIRAYKLARKFLVVSGIIGQGKGQPYQDGILTKWGTFERYYSVRELREWIEQILGVSAIALDGGIYLVTKKPSLIAPQIVAPHLLQRTYAQLEKRRALLQRDWIPPLDARIEKSKPHNAKDYYYRLRSNTAALEENKKTLYLGKLGSDKYEGAVAALQRRDEFLLIERRLSKLSQLFANDFS